MKDTIGNYNMKIEKERSKEIINVLWNICNEERAQKYDESKYFVKAIAYLKDKNILVSSNGALLGVWKVNDNSLLNILSRECSGDICYYQLVRQDELFPVMFPKGKQYPPVKSLLYKYEDYIPLDKDEALRYYTEMKSAFIMYIELACLITKCIYNPKWFNMLRIFKFNTLWYDKKDRYKPVMLKSNSDRFIAYIMPAIKKVIDNGVFVLK